MKSVSKSFLVPVVVAIAALISTPSFATQQKTADVGHESSPMDAINLASDANKQMIQIVRGNELHGLLLVKNNDGQIFADHYSHSSHASHSSHSSHYSSRY